MRRRQTLAEQAEDLHSLLRERSATVAAAESLTGGRLCAALATAPGASDVLRGGVVSYATDVKTSVLGVPEGVVDRYGVISAECAGAMARGVRSLLGASFGVATTGVAGPASQEDHPPGTVYVAVTGATDTAVAALELPGDRDAVVEATCRAALSALSDMIVGDDPEQPAVV